jgi:hypothetical protein
MSVKSIRQTQQQIEIASVPTTTSVDATANPELEIPLDFESGSHLLVAYTEYMEGICNRKTNQFNTLRNNRFLQFGFIALIATFIISFCFSMIGNINYNIRNFVANILSLISTAWIIFFFIKIGNHVTSETNENIQHEIYPIKNLILDLERLTYRVSIIHEREPLTDWQALELKVRLQRAEDALMDAREILKRYSPKETTK